jgi:hypothetical protein
VHGGDEPRRWIPAFAGMTKRSAFTSAFSQSVAHFPGCGHRACIRDQQRRLKSMNLRSFVVRLGGAALLATMFTLAGCNAHVRRGAETTVNVPQQYDMTIGAYKDNQFMLDGAVLSSPDLEAHFRYLQDQKQLPKTVLLKDTDDAKINNADLEEFASLQLSFKFTGYVMHKGKLTLMSAVQGKKGNDDSEQDQDKPQHPRHHRGGDGPSGA